MAAGGTWCRWGSGALQKGDTGSCQARPGPPPRAWGPGPSLTEFRLLQKYLGEGPANAPDERGPQHQGEALHVELGGLVSEHEEAPGDEEDHEDQSRSLLGWGAVIITSGVPRSVGLEFGVSNHFGCSFYPPPHWGGRHSSFPSVSAELASSWHVPSVPAVPKVLTCFPLAVLGPGWLTPPLNPQTKDAPCMAGSLRDPRPGTPLHLVTTPATPVSNCSQCPAPGSSSATEFLPPGLGLSLLSHSDKPLLRSAFYFQHLRR